jgi:6-phosphofructokinase 2
MPKDTESIAIGETDEMNTAQSKRIFTLTLNPTMVLSSSVPNVFPVHTLRCGAARTEPGGGGMNVSRAIKKLGGESIALHFCGGPTGDILRELLDEERIEHRPIAISGWTRQSVMILETATGQQYRFVMPGPTFTEEEWRGALEQIAELEAMPDLFVASGSLPPGVPDDFYGQLARTVRARGSRLILDTSGHALAAAVEAGVFLIKPSLRELRTFAQVELVHEAEQEATVKAIIDSGACEAVVVSHGAAGVLFASRGRCERLRSPTVPVRSKVGAGDSMVAGIVLALARGHSLRDAVRFGIAAGAAAVMNDGTELCRREDAERLLDQVL